MIDVDNIIINSDIFYHKECDLGLGIFAKRDIFKDEIIHRFSGRIINHLESKSIPDKEECKALQIGFDKYLDLDIPGVLINHSCNPNCGIKNDYDLIALRRITKDEQIMYDYSTTMDDGYSMECRCNSKNCRKIVEDFKLIGIDKQIYYLEKDIVMSYIKVQYAELLRQPIAISHFSRH
jgi:uncharacterized protein